MTRSGLALLLLALSLAVGAGAWLFTHFERVPTRDRVGFQGEARRNPYLAALRLLERLGLDARETRSLPALRTLPGRGVLVLARGRRGLTPDLQAALLQWVGQGGRLIAEGEAREESDPLLDALGVGRAAVEERTCTAPEITARGGETPPRVDPRGGGDEDEGYRLQVEGKPAARLLNLPRGAGWVTVVTDLAFISNADIADDDHAELLWQLVNLGGAPEAVVFLTRPSESGLLRWLLDRVPATLASAAVWLALWLWRAVPRAGPVAPDPERVRRRLLDHVRASGRFHWSAGGGARLLEAARDACLRAVARAQPDFPALSPPERLARLTGSFGLSPEEARQVLAGEPPQRVREFTGRVRLFQTLQARLAPSGAGGPRAGGTSG